MRVYGLTHPRSRPGREDVDQVDGHAAELARLAPGPDATVGQRWRFRRNLVLYIASQQGVSQRMLADVFDLPRSSVYDILREMRALVAKLNRPGMAESMDRPLQSVASPLDGRDPGQLNSVG